MTTNHRIVVIGVGSIGERHTRCFLATGRADVGIVEVNAALRDTIRQRYNLTRVFDSLEPAIADGFELALVATPAQMHIPMATKLVNAGLHVLIEKPLSTSFDGLDELKRLAAAKRRLVGVAYTWRSWPAFTAMKDAVRAGRFGKPLQVVVTGGQHFPHFRPAYRDIYYKDRRTGGGAIQDGLTHLINAVEWIVGPADKLFADAAHLALEGVTVEDHVHLISRHGPVMASFTFSQQQAPNEISIQVVCERGTARFESWNNRWRWMTGPTDTWHDEEGGKMERDDLYVTQANAFLDAVEGKRPLLCTLEEAEQTLRVNLAALKSADHPAWTAVR